MQYKVKQSGWIIAVMVIGGLIWSCNPTKDKWLNRNWHTLTGHYNVYFNGEIKFNEAVEGFEKGVQNNFNKILPVFIKPDEAASKGMSGVMDEVIKKASTSIQMHYVGRYTDDSYFLMGRAQYYKGDYFAALETFQYINSKYKGGDLNKVSTAWIARCYDALEKQGEAEAVMGLLLSEIDPTKMLGRKKVPESMENKAVKITKAHRSFIYATAADIYIKQEKYTLAADRLKIALANTTQKPLKIRYNYILGQLYLLSDSVPQAKMHFSKVVKLLAPYDFEFNANLNLTRTYDPNNPKEVKQVKRNLKRMLRDDKNEGLYDQVYFELAKVEYRDKKIPEAIKNYKLSVAKSTKNQAQKAESYLALGNIYLDMPDYKLGQAYYDSAAQVIPKDHKNYQKVQDKKIVLSELIENILTIEAQDSLQSLSKLSKTDLEKRVDGWILALKIKQEQEAKAAAEQKELAQQAELNKPIGGAPTLPNLGVEQGQWYFYNTSVMNAGQTEFFSQRKWGRRENEDFWRIAAKEKAKENASAQEDGDKGSGKDSSVVKGGTSTGDGNKEESGGDAGTEKPKVNDDKAAWVKDIPYSAEEKKESNEKIKEAYYNLGIIYDEKLKDGKEAIKSFTTLLSRFPDNEYEPEVLYYLFRLYNAQKETANAEKVRGELIRKYPDSKYALILQNKPIQTEESKTKKEIILAYEALYQQYQDGNYNAVKQGKLEADKKYSGNAIQGKFDLLYAMAVGKTDSLGVFRTELEDIVKAYPNTDVAQRAQSILDAIKRQATSGTAAVKDTVVKFEDEYKLIPGAAHYYLFATKAEKLDLNDVLQKLANYNDEYNQFDNLRANTMMSAEGHQLIFVREFASLAKAADYINGLNLTQFYKKNLPENVSFTHFAIEKEQFKKLLKDKKVDQYAAYFNEQLPQILKQQKQ